ETLKNHPLLLLWKNFVHVVPRHDVSYAQVGNSLGKNMSLLSIFTAHPNLFGKQFVACKVKPLLLFPLIYEMITVLLLVSRKCPII
ncbi:hypothetical protein BOW41_12540, partial [Solemya velum gill symbiont]